MAVKLASIFFTMILVDNYVLAKFLGICPFLGVSKKLDSAVGMSLAVTFVMVMATAATWPGSMSRPNRSFPITASAWAVTAVSKLCSARFSRMLLRIKPQRVMLRIRVIMAKKPFFRIVFPHFSRCKTIVAGSRPRCKGGGKCYNLPGHSARKYSGRRSVRPLMALWMRCSRACLSWLRVPFSVR